MAGFPCFRLTVFSFLAAVFFFLPAVVSAENLSHDSNEWVNNPDYWQGAIIDAHSQVDLNTDLAGIVPLLNRAGVSKALISTRFNQSSDDIIKLHEKYPERIIPLAKTKTKAFMKGRKGFPKDFFAEISKFDYKGMAEIIMWHAAKKKVGAGKAVVSPDNPRITPLIETARKKGWPYIAHIEFSAMEFESEKQEFMKKFNQFVSTNKDVSIGLIHMGQLNSEEAGDLLKNHSNLFFITSHCNPVALSISGQPWTKLFKNSMLKPEWRQLITDHPDKFVLGFDNVFSFHWEDKFYPQVLFWRKALKTLPENIANAVAHDNAKRLWKIDSHP